MDFLKVSDRLQKIAKECWSSIAQAQMGITETDVIDMGGKRNVGIYRIREAANSLRWCASQFDNLAAEIAAEQQLAGDTGERAPKA